VNDQPIRRADALASIPTPEQLAAFVDDPLTQLPEEWRPAVWDFWTFYSDVLNRQLGLCSRLRRWIAADGLELAEVLVAFDTLMSPARSAEFNFPSQVLGALGDEIEANRKRKRDRERREAARKEWDTSKPADVVASMAEHFGVMPKPPFAGTPPDGSGRAAGRAKNAEETQKGASRARPAPKATETPRRQSMAEDGEAAVAELPPGEIAIVGVYSEPDDGVPIDKCIIDPDPDDAAADTLAALKNDELDPVELDDSEEPDTVLSLNPALAYDSPERLAEWDAETVRMMNEANAQAKEAEAYYEERKKEAKEAKEEWELAAKRLSKLIDERAAGRGKPLQQTLFDENGNVRASTEVKAQTHWAAQDDPRSPDEVPAPRPAEDEAWKAVPLSDLVEHDGLPEKVLEILKSPEHKDRGPIPPITTMGELAKYTSPEESGWTKKLTDIKGLGPVKEEALTEATDKFWKRWNAMRAADANRCD
jgi:hypothetical protein